MGSLSISFHTSYPVGLTSKLPVTVVKKQPEGFWHRMLHARTAGLNLIVTHLSPFEWKFRAQEAEAHNGADTESLSEHYPVRLKIR